MRISLLHATYQSLGQARLVRDTWLKRANYPSEIEHCLAFEYDDALVRKEFGILREADCGFTKDKMTKFITTHSDLKPSTSRNWNAAARISTGDVLIVIADDIIPEDNWDLQVLSLFASFNVKESLLFVLTDSRCVTRTTSRDNFLPRHPLLTRSFYLQQGFIFPESIHAYGMDNQLLQIAVSTKALRDSRDIVLHHSRGFLFDDAGKIRCGCNEQLSDNPNQLSPSKIRMESFKLNASEKLNTRITFFSWDFVSALLCTNIVCETVFSTYMKIVQTRPDLISARVIIVSPLRDSELSLIEKILYSIRLLRNYWNFLKSRSSSPR